jgi:hypothetical protein
VWTYSFCYNMFAYLLKYISIYLYVIYISHLSFLTDDMNDR